MKLNKFLLSAIAAASLTACSDSTDVVDSNKGHWNADGTGYVSLSISMPDNVGSKGSRATTNDKFEKGDDNEYVVNNATLVIFSGNTEDSEGNYTLDAAYKLPLKFQTINENGQQIISKATITQQINKISKAKAKALVILNLPSGLSLDDSKHELNKISTTGGTASSTTLKGTTFTDFQAIELTLNTDVANGFTMTNAPLTNAYSTATGLMPTDKAKTTTTLADIKDGSIKSTPEEAAANKAADIYVERSVAKVTVKKGTGLATSDKIPDTDIHFEVQQFALDNTNNTSFLVRNVDNSWADLVSQSQTVASYQDKYRFVGFGEVEAGKGYRTYWAKDPNYDADLTPSTTAPVFIDLSENNSLYCMENTFNVAHQTHKNTTRAVVKVQLWKDATNKGKTHYMYNNDPSTFDVTNSLDELKTNSNLLAATNNVAIVKANNKTVTALDFEEAKDKNSKVLQGYKQIKSVTFNDGTTVDASTTTPGASEIFNSIKNYFGNIAVYEKGYAYYNVLIKHFGDDLTPWNITDAGKKEWETQPSAGDIDKIYPKDTRRDANYLGRYGVVRNNWYELTVNSVKKPGKPGIDTPDDTPDDELNSYISVSINILSWAKRSQDVDLQ